MNKKTILIFTLFSLSYTHIHSASSTQPPTETIATTESSNCFLSCFRSVLSCECFSSCCRKNYCCLQNCCKDCCQETNRSSNQSTSQQDSNLSNANSDWQHWQVIMQIIANNPTE